MNLRVVQWIAIAVTASAALLLAAVIVASPFLSSTTRTLIEAPTIGFALGSLLVRVAEMCRQMRAEKREETRNAIAMFLPRTVVGLGAVEDGERLLAVTLNNGDSRLIRVPEDYAPDQDGGELVMRLAAPELFGPDSGLDFTIEREET